MELDMTKITLDYYKVYIKSLLQKLPTSPNIIFHNTLVSAGEPSVFASGWVEIPLKKSPQPRYLCWKKQRFILGFISSYSLWESCGKALGPQEKGEGGTQKERVRRQMGPKQQKQALLINRMFLLSTAQPIKNGTYL